MEVNYLSVLSLLNSLTLDQYQTLAGNTAVYKGQGAEAGANYTILGLVGEAGEIANKFKKILRNGDDYSSATKRLELSDELGDVLWYAALLASELGMSLNDVAKMNLRKLAERAKAGTLKNREVVPHS